MLHAYSDRGAKPEADGIMCVAAAVFKPTPYKRFVKQWQLFLRGWGAHAFHATDFYPGGREFKRTRPDGTLDPELVARYERDSRRLPEFVSSHVHQLFVVSFKEQEFEAVAPLAWRARFGDVYTIAAQLMVDSIGYWAERARYKAALQPRDMRKDIGALIRALRLNNDKRIDVRLVTGLELEAFLISHGCQRKSFKIVCDHSHADDVAV